VIDLNNALSNCAVSYDAMAAQETEAAAKCRGYTARGLPGFVAEAAAHDRMAIIWKAHAKTAREGFFLKSIGTGAVLAPAGFKEIEKAAYDAHRVKYANPLSDIREATFG
jgi:hypothetical protein